VLRTLTAKVLFGPSKKGAQWIGSWVANANCGRGQGKRFG
jgi:hypothetical protein